MHFPKARQLNATLLNEEGELVPLPHMATIPQDRLVYIHEWTQSSPFVRNYCNMFKKILLKLVILWYGARNSNIRLRSLK